jgi:uncharacterized protein
MPSCRECCFRTDGTDLSKVIWEVTFICPLQCPYCFQERTGHRDKLDRTQRRQVHRKVYDLLRETRPQQVILSGGEPLVLGEDLVDIVKNLQALEIPFSLSTLGFPEDTFLKVLEYQPKTINISIDPEGMSEGQYKQRKTTFEILKTLLKTIADRNIPVKGTSIITRENLQNVPVYIEMLAKLRDEIPTLTTLYVTNPYHIGYSRPDLSVTPEEVSAFITSVDELRSRGLNLQYVNFSSISMPLQECPAARSIYFVAPNGDIAGCPFLYQRSTSFSVGNVMVNTVDEIRRSLGQFAEVAVHNTAQLLDLTTECKDCPVRQDCRGGCYAETFAMKETSIPSLLCRRTVESARKRDSSLVSLPFRIRSNLVSGSPKTTFGRKRLSKSLEEKIGGRVHEYMNSMFSDIAHNYDHIERVVALAKHIGIQEGANMRIVIPAAYFHDFAPRQYQAFHLHTDESADFAAEFLAENGFDEDEITAVVHCIIASEFSSFLLGIEPKTLDAKVVRDADWLDAIGATGIARVFSFAGKYCDRIGSVEFDPRRPHFVFHNIMAPDETPMEHFAAKLLRIKDLLQTATGRKLGNERHKFMVDFLTHFQREAQIES